MAWLIIGKPEFINLRNVKRIEVEGCDKLTEITVEYTDPHDELPDTEHYQIEESYEIVYKTIQRILSEADRYGGVFNLEREIERTKRLTKAYEEIKEEKGE